MRCIFVLDIFNGKVVHAIRGERRMYVPIENYSQIVSTSDPLEILQEINPKEVYVADLNRLMGLGDNTAIIKEISCLTRTMADIGASQIRDLEHLPNRVCPVLGTETASLRLIEEATMLRHTIASIDMKCRKVLTCDPELEKPPLEILRRLNGLSLGDIILLELDRVGTSSGLDLEFLENAARVSDHSLILGGGVQGTNDLKILAKLGFGGALVATAVHNKCIPLDLVRG